ncbi:YHS domain protein [Plantactinospora soyae]|uniref:YHS domain-containing protein n=1 Tax=Plantactinospora soyae TaxID=1544732 RepID=A0A927QZR7_9ACTN|nr:YHS domain protein [Plantactinospora soyae]MBE1487888.1 YHS domain-containing protein [Plantactinospora soyae]
MIFVELTTAKGNLDPEQRLRVAQRIGSMHELSGGAEVQPGTAEVFRSMFQVVIHEPEVWVVGEEPLAPADPPRYVVRAYVPAPWRKELSQPLIAHVTKVVSELGAGDDRAEPGREPAVLVLVLGISEGAIGLDGVPRTSTDLVEMLGEPYRNDLAAGRAVKDPLCGVIVPLNENAVTLDLDGTRYGFCCSGCRDTFVARRRGEGVRV